MSELQDKARELFAKRHPKATFDVVKALADAWLKATDDNARLLLSSEELAPKRDAFADQVEAANADLLPHPAAEKTPAPIGKRALKDLTTSEQRVLVAEKFGIPPRQALGDRLQPIAERNAEARAVDGNATAEAKNQTHSKADASSRHDCGPIPSVAAS